MEDSVSITTERSSNAESFSFNIDYPIQLNFVFKDCKENSSGLEYTSARNQQTGDGGFIRQFMNNNPDELIAASNTDRKYLLTHQAPLDRSCEDYSSNPGPGEGSCRFRVIDEPAGWKSLNCDNSWWPDAIQHSALAIDPKGKRGMTEYTGTITQTCCGVKIWKPITRFSVARRLANRTSQKHLS